ncbi:MAG TPA: competence/damage-inducible protein A [Pseudobdellovibrionaceae bacterium]|jgi:molybdenum cofactor synthesis domain-containing protein
MQVAIISIGTELTIGQIINKNSAWISKNLKDLGVPTRCHLVVPDDRELILDALRFCAERCDTLFVTGGLGPTTDDFTRELISEWSGLALEFHEASWEHVNQRLKSRGVNVREAQRQQCFFPKGARILPNSEGTANAFQLRVFNKDVIVLPGPPNEIAAIWKSSLDSFLREKTKDLDKSITYSWETLGLGESDVAHITEDCLRGIEIEKGYRAHLPYVEVKVTFLESRTKQLMPAIQRLDEALHNVTVARNGEDVPSLIAKKLTHVKELQVVDSLSGQAVLNRLSPVSATGATTWSFSNHNNFSADPQVLKMILRPWGTTGAIAEISYRGASFKTILEAPSTIPKITERKALYFAERAMIFWLQKLEDLI